MWSPRRTYQRTRQEDPGVAAPQGPPQTWVCEACTFANDAAISPLVCSVCETARANLDPEEAGHWACGACTFFNGPAALQCEMCGSGKPPPRPSRLARVLQEDTSSARRKQSIRALAIDTSFGLGVDPPSARPELLTPSASQLRALRCGNDDHDEFKHTGAASPPRDSASAARLRDDVGGASRAAAGPASAGPVETTLAATASTRAHGIVDHSPARLVAAVAKDELFAAESILRSFGHAANPRPHADALDPASEWIAAINSVSSEAAGFERARLVGVPQVFTRERNHGLIVGCWHPATPASAEREFVEFLLARAVFPTSIHIAETCNPGAVVRIAAHDGSRWVDLWTGPVSPTFEPAARMFSPPLFQPAFASRRYRIELDTAAFLPDEFKAIDAVRVDGDAIRASADPAHGFDVWQRSPLMVAAKNGSASLAALLLARNADPSRKSMWGYSPLDWAVFAAKTREPPVALPVLDQPTAVAAAAAESAAAVAADVARGPRGRYRDIICMLLAQRRVHEAFAAAAAWFEHDLSAAPRAPRPTARASPTTSERAPRVGAAGSVSSARGRGRGRSGSTGEARRRSRSPGRASAGPASEPARPAARSPRESGAAGAAVASASDADLTSSQLTPDEVATLLAADPRSLGASRRHPASPPTVDPIVAAAAHADPSALPRGLRRRVYAQNAVGETVFHHAVTTRDAATLELLLAFGTLPADVTNDIGETAEDAAGASRDAALAAVYRRAMRAAEQPLAPLADVLDARPIDIFALGRFCRETQPPDALQAALNRPDARGVLPLQTAVRARRPDVLAMLLAFGADPLEYDRFGNCALFTAARGGAADAVRIMLASPGVVAELGSAVAPSGPGGRAANRGSELGWANANGDTLLHAAATSGHVHIVELLLALPPAIGWAATHNNQGRRPVELATVPAVVDAFARATHALEAGERDAASALEPLLLSDEPLVCAVCMLPPESADEPLAHACECGASVCTGCFMHLTSSALMVGEIPKCCNERCAQIVPLATLRRHVSIDQLLVVTALAVNARIAVESVYRLKCPVCLRANDMREALAGSSSRIQCAHCRVGLCAVCTGVYPQVAAPRTADERARNELDNALHKDCKGKFASLRLFMELYAMLEARGLRQCPTCGTAGLKDDKCTHTHCPNSCPDYCYVCGKNSSQLNGVGVSTHGSYDMQWIREPSFCPMYIHHLAYVDERCARLGCGNGECRPRGSCPQDSVCRVVRDTWASAWLNQVRVRCYVLDFVYRVGKREFVAMLDRFAFRDVMNVNYFNSRFPFDGDEIPQWWSFEPESLWPFLRQRLRWFVMPADLPRFVAAAGQDADGLDVGAANTGGGLNPPHAAAGPS